MRHSLPAHVSPTPQVGEMMDGRYEVFEFKGKGVFSSVLRARDRSRVIAGSATSAEGENVAEVR